MPPHIDALLYAAIDACLMPRCRYATPFFALRHYVAVRVTLRVMRLRCRRRYVGGIMVSML